MCLGKDALTQSPSTFRDDPYDDDCDDEGDDDGDDGGDSDDGNSGDDDGSTHEARVTKHGRGCQTRGPEARAASWHQN